MRIKKWGNSLALRIPKAFASQAQLKEASAVELSVIEGKLVVTPLARNPYTLKALLDGVTPANLHGEWETGPDQGNEIV